MKLPLAYYGNPVLRKKGALVEKFDEEIRQLVNDMTETLYAHRAIGIAAPQVNRSLAIFLIYPPGIHKDGSLDWGERRQPPPQLFINPRIIEKSDEVVTMDEGCLSIPKVYGEVTRPVSIRVEAMDIDGNAFQNDLTGWAARIFMHENDHINGILFIDRMESKAKREIEGLLRELKKKYKG